MKTTAALLTILLALTTQAKVSDFNSLIEENSKAQAELHTNLKDNLELARMAVQKESQEKYIVDRSSDTTVVPTSKSFLTFAKEKKYYRASGAAQQKRLAQDLSDAQ